VTWVPRVLGIDDAGREVLEYIDGVVGHGEPGWLFADEVLGDVARALREWHDATATFERRDDDAWWFPGKEPGEVICHNDFAPYNHVFREGRWVGAIDFDICYPAPRLWDMAWAAYRYVPLRPQPGDEQAPPEAGEDVSPLPLQDQLRRLDAFLGAYAGGDAELRYPAAQLLGFAVARLEAIASWCAAHESEDMRRNGLMYSAHAAWIARGAFGPCTPARVNDASA